MKFDPKNSPRERYSKTIIADELKDDVKIKNKGKKKLNFLAKFFIGLSLVVMCSLTIVLLVYTLTELFQYA
ncbi:hypothetical protein [Ureaplasma canigenitalium]|uniref:hypothetical protein n=1 Tax=Ureaplasma canigenitalium TaxID=42092 RepID=UPI0004E0C933|nr:hypothetical protein [Ureaplasma canigenitalium]